MKYFDELVKSMKWLDKQPNTLFIGQSVVWDGHALFKTMKEVSQEKRLEFPVVEDFQMGFSLGMALEGYVPISIFPRWDFLILATNQLVNHVDKFPIISNGLVKPKLIIRTTVGSKVPLNPGPQHCNNYSDAFRLLLKTVELIEITKSEDVFDTYQKAYEEKDKSFLIVEYMDMYNEK